MHAQFTNKDQQLLLVFQCRRAQKQRSATTTLALQSINQPASHLFLQPTNSYLYEAICRQLAAHIHERRFEPGLVLLEKPLADAFRTSRAPVQRALAELEANDLIHRFDGRGYLVGSKAQSGILTPIRRALKPLLSELGNEPEESIPARSSWELIYVEVEQVIASSLVFGCYRIIEADLAAHYDVSRTVARDVLSRLQHSGLVRKSSSSHWLAGPLTAKDIRELYEIRSALEPLALRTASQSLSLQKLGVMRENCEAALRDPDGPSAAVIDLLERELHDELLLIDHNEHLSETLRRIQLPLMQAERYLRALGIPTDPQLPSEHRIVIDLLMAGSTDAACAALAAHLQAEARRSINHLKTAAVFPEPTLLAPYLHKVIGEHNYVIRL